MTKKIEKSGSSEGSLRSARVQLHLTQRMKKRVRKVVKQEEHYTTMNDFIRSAIGSHLSNYSRHFMDEKPSISKVHKPIVSRGRTVKPEEIMLFMYDSNGEVTTRDCAAEFDQSRSSMYKKLRRLETRNYVVRTEIKDVEVVTENFKGTKIRRTYPQQFWKLHPDQYRKVTEWEELRDRIATSS